MSEIHNTFTERFLRAQITFEQPYIPPANTGDGDGTGQRSGAARRGPQGGGAPTRRFNALGVLEDVAPENGEGTDVALDIGPPETPGKGTSVRPEPTVHVGGKSSSLSNALAVGGAAAAAGKDWSNVGRNDPCPCGSGRKFKKCHGANL
jgi:preprotein translocase subunit SecA